MNYELLLSDVREVTKEKLKEISFNLDASGDLAAADSQIADPASQAEAQEGAD